MTCYFIIPHWAPFWNITSRMEALAEANPGRLFVSGQITWCLAQGKFARKNADPSHYLRGERKEFQDCDGSPLRKRYWQRCRGHIWIAKG